MSASLKCLLRRRPKAKAKDHFADSGILSTQNFRIKAFKSPASLAALLPSRRPRSPGGHLPGLHFPRPSCSGLSPPPHLTVKGGPGARTSNRFHPVLPSPQPAAVCSRRSSHPNRTLPAGQDPIQGSQLRPPFLGSVRLWQVPKSRAMVAKNLQRSPE